MNGSSTPSPPVVVRPGRGTPPSPRSTRWVDRGLAVGCAVVVAVSMLVWTGVVPSGLYPSSPLRWTVELRTCPSAIYAQSIQYAFPLWATVHVRWTSGSGFVDYYILNTGFGRASYPLAQAGVSGSGSFVSDATFYEFVVLGVLVNLTGCSVTSVTTTVSYTL